MPQSGTGERVTPVLDFPSRDGLSVQAIRVDYEPGGFTAGTHRHPAGAYVYVIDGSVEFVVGDGEPIVLPAGESFYEPPGAMHSVSRNASEDVPASLVAFFVLGDGDSATVYDRG
jgi:quercetin dioxygenase-like cupin family protein